MAFDIMAGGVICTKCGDPITPESLGWVSIAAENTAIPAENIAASLPFCRKHLGSNSRIERLVGEAIEKLLSYKDGDVHSVAISNPRWQVNCA